MPLNDKYQAVDRAAVRKKIDTEVQQLSLAERQFVKTILTVQPDCPLWLREQILFSLGECADLDPMSPVAQAVMALTVSCRNQSEIETLEAVRQRDLLRALNLTEKVIVAAQFLERLVTDIFVSITDRSTSNGDDFVNRTAHV